MGSASKPCAPRPRRVRGRNRRRKSQTTNLWQLLRLGWQQLYLHLFLLIVILLVIVGFWRLPTLIEILISDPHLALLHVTLVQPDGAVLPRVHQQMVLQLLKIDLGTPMLRINVDAIAQRARQYPWVRYAVVQRRWPNQLMVWVSLHQARLLVALDTVWVVNAEGEIFKKLYSQDELTLPVVTGMLANKEQGQVMLHTALRRVMALVEHTEKQLLDYGLLEEIHWDDSLGFTIEIRGKLAPQGVRMHLGVAPEERLAVALAGLQLCAKLHQEAQIIWADGDKHPERISIHLAPPQNLKSDDSFNITMRGLNGTKI